MRYLTLTPPLQLDLGARHRDADARRAAQARGDLLIPIVKGWCTETGVEIASLGIQVHGGMGYIEETGAAQSLRDARISTIYEGTTGIQAGDLIGRKLAQRRWRPPSRRLRPISMRSSPPTATLGHRRDRGGVDRRSRRCGTGRARGYGRQAA